MATTPQISEPGPVKTVIKTVGGPVGSAINTGIGLIPGVGGLESAAHTTEQLVEDITSPKFWLRIGEGLVGIILIIVGLDHVFDVSGKAQSAAKKVGPLVAAVT